MPFFAQLHVCPPREHARTLAVRDGTIWLWPGVPLSVRLGAEVHPLPDDCTRFWITRLHGFEAQHAPIESALRLASTYLTDRDHNSAQTILDSCGIDRLSPEGAVLAGKVAERLGIPVPAARVGSRSLPWGASDVDAQVELFEPFVKAAQSLLKAWDPDKHPRWDKDTPDGIGGRFKPTEGSSSADTLPEARPGNRHNGGPPLDELPEIPEEKISLAPARNALLRRIGVWLIERGIIALIPGVGEAAMIVQVGLWLYEYLPYLDAYIQPPQSLEDLQDAVGASKPGTEIHHIVEQTSARQDGYPEAEINSRENTVRISTLKHYEISGWYSTPNSGFGGLSPRDYLRGKDWAERMRVGREALIRFKVLKP